MVSGGFAFAKDIFFHRLVVEDVLIENLSQNLGRYPLIPDAVRVNHHYRAVDTAVQAAREGAFHLARCVKRIQAVLLNQAGELGVNISRHGRVDTTAVGADENLALWIAGVLIRQICLLV